MKIIAIRNYVENNNYFDWKSHVQTWKNDCIVLIFCMQKKTLGDDSKVAFYVNYIDFKGVAPVYIVLYLKCQKIPLILSQQ